MLDKNLIGIEPDFSKNSNYNPDANVAQVKFGADAPVLEVELNELQQVQDKAREDLIRSMIPSGFTKPVIIDFYHDKTNSNTLYTLEDAEAYVNGMRIFIPKGTKIDLGDSPKKDIREDLIFLEVWKEEVDSKVILSQYGGEGQKETQNNLIDPRVGEETSHRILNKWRIRCAQDIDFGFKGDSTTTTNCSDTYIGWIDDRKFSKVYAKGADPLIELPTNINGIEIFRSANSNWNGSSPINDTGLWIAGLKNQKQSINRFKTIDGLVYAIPMFKLLRRPNQGFSLGDYSNISRLTDQAKLSLLLQNEKLSSVATGELECILEGNTLTNLINLRGFNNEGVSGWDSTTNSGFLQAPETNISFGIDCVEEDSEYTMIFTGSVKDYSSSKDNKLRMDIYPDTFPELPWVELGSSDKKFYINFRTPKSLKGAESIRMYSGGNNGNLQVKNVMLIKGRFNEKNAPKFFKGTKSVGDYSVKFDKFISWGAEVVNGTSQDDIATIPMSLSNPYIRVVPVNNIGEEIVDANIAFKLLNSLNNELGWDSCPNTAKIDKYQDVCFIKVFCNNIAKSNKISGFNIYTGYNVVLKSVDDKGGESTIEFHTKQPIRSIPNSDIRDLMFGDGRIFRRVAIGKLDNTSNWSSQILTSKDTNYLIFQVPIENLARTRVYSSLPYVDILGDIQSQGINKEFLGVYKGNNILFDWLYLSIKKTKLESQDLEGLRKYLKANPIEFYYEKKDTTLNPYLPNGVRDFNDYNGNITRNVGFIKEPKTLNWGLDVGITQTASCMRFSVELSDKKPITDNIYGGGVLNHEIQTKRCVAEDSGYNRDLPRLWCWYKKSIYVDVSASMIGVDFASDSNETKISKFKTWIAGKGAIFYEKEIAKIEKYDMDYATIKGNLICCDNSEAKIESNLIVQPNIILRHKAELNLNLPANYCFITTDSVIPPINLEVNGQTSKTGSLKLNLSSRVDNAPVRLEGQTLINLFTIDRSHIAEHNKQCVCESDNKDIYTGKQYSLINLISKSIAVNVYKKNPSGYLRTITLKGNSMLTITLNENEYIYSNNGVYDGSEWNGTQEDLELLKQSLLVLEGDWTDKITPKYFEGVKSFGELSDDTNKVSVLSCGKNLLGLAKLHESVKVNGNELIFSDSSKYMNKLVGKENTRYTFSCKAKKNSPSNQVNFTHTSLTIFYTDGTSQRAVLVDSNEPIDVLKENIKVVSEPSKTIKGFVVWGYDNTSTLVDFMIEEGVERTSYEPPKSSKRVLLLAEPIREGDYINGDENRVTVHRNCRQFTITIEDKIELDKSYSTENTLAFHIYSDELLDKKPAKNQYDTSTLKCDKFISDSWFNIYNSMLDKEMIAPSVDNNGAIYIKVLKSKLTSHDLDGVKKWLRDNPITLLYKLASTKVELVKSVFNSSIQNKVDLTGQVGYKSTNESGIDCGVVGLSPILRSSWSNKEVRECTYTYQYGDIQDLLGVPLRIGGGYAFSSDFQFKIVKVLGSNKALVQNIGKTLIENLDRGFYPTPVCATTPNEFTTENLQKFVSFTGIDYNNLLEKLVCKHLY